MISEDKIKRLLINILRWRAQKRLMISKTKNGILRTSIEIYIFFVEKMFRLKNIFYQHSILIFSHTNDSNVFKLS